MTRTYQFVINNHASFHLCSKQNLVKRQKSQNIMTMIVVNELPPDLLNNLRIRILGICLVLQKDQNWADIQPRTQSSFLE